MQNYNEIPNTGTIGGMVTNINANFQLTKEMLERLEITKDKSVGLFSTLASLQATYPSPEVGDWALVGDSTPFAVYKCTTAGTWSATGGTYDAGTIDLDGYVTQDDFDELAADINGSEKNYEMGYLSANGEVRSSVDWIYQTDYIPINVGDTIEWNAGDVSSSGAVRAILYTSEKAYRGYYGATSSPKTFTISNESDKYIRASYSYANKNDAYLKINGVIVWRPQEDEAGIRGEIEDIDERLSKLSASALVWVEGKQIYTNEGVGNTCSYVTYESANWRSIKGDCEGGQKIYLTNTQGGNSPRAWCFLDADNVILSVAAQSVKCENVEVEAPAGARYFVLNDNVKTGEAYLYTETPLDIKIENLESGGTAMPLRVSNCRSFGAQPAANGTSGSFFNITSGTYSDLITNIYEPLRAANPHYISRTNIGKDASGTIDMWAYVFEPRYWQQSIYLQAGIHGIEVDAVACLARIAQLIANSDGSNEDLEFLRQRVKITIIPCVNVWGISQSPKSNNNSNNVGLQAWSTATPPAEVANIKAYIAEQGLVDEVSFMLDMHTTTNDSYRDFYGNIQKYAKNVRAIYRTNAWLCDKYALDGRTVDDQYLGYHEYADNHLFRQYYYYVEGVQTATLELSDYHWDSSLSTSPVITMGVTMWLNYIIQMANDGYVIPIGIPEEDYRESRG